MKLSKQIVIYFRKSEYRSGIGQVFGKRSSLVDKDIYEIDKAIPDLILDQSFGPDLLYTTTFCRENKRLYHVLGYCDNFGVSLVFIYNSALCKRLTEKVKSQLAFWAEENLFSVGHDWGKRRKEEK